MIYKSQSVSLCVSLVLAKPRTPECAGQTLPPSYRTDRPWTCDPLASTSQLIFWGFATRPGSEKSRLSALLVQYLGKRDS